METKLEDNRIIRTVRTEINVPHLEEIITLEGIITFGLPLVGPDCYQEVMGKITQEGMLRPTTAQTFSLIDWALRNPDEEHCKDILFKLRNDYWLWTSTKRLYTPNEVIVYDDVDGNMPSDKKSLKRFKDRDISIRVVPYGFKTKSQSISELVKNPYIIAQVGNKDFAEDVVARVAEKISGNNPYVWALDPVNKDTKIYSALFSCYGSGLYVGGCHGEWGGYASGVCKGVPKAPKIL